jgi:hypothetical protein
MLNDAVVNDWLVRSPFVKAKKGELSVGSNLIAVIASPLGPGLLMGIVARD